MDGEALALRAGKASSVWAFLAVYHILVDLTSLLLIRLQRSTSYLGTLRSVCSRVLQERSRCGSAGVGARRCHIARAILNTVHWPRSLKALAVQQTGNLDLGDPLARLWP